MRSRDLLLTLALAGAVALGGCGGDEPTAPAAKQGPVALATVEPQSDLASLVPANTDILLYVPSVDALAAKVRRIVALFGEEAAREIDVDGMLGEIAGPLLDLLDKGRPMAMAMALPPDGKGDPAPTVIFPMTDVDAAVKRFTDQGRDAPATKGSYVSLAMGPAGKLTGDAPPIAQALPRGDIVARVDLARVFEVYGEELKQQLARGLQEGTPPTGASGMDMAAFMKSIEGLFHDFIDSAETLDVAVEIDDTNVHCQGLFTAKAGSKMDGAERASGDLVQMAGTLPGDFPVVALLSLDFQKLMDWMSPFMDAFFEALPEDKRATYEAEFDKAMKVYDHLGDNHAFAFRMDEGGMAVAWVSDLRDSEKFFTEWEAIMSGPFVEMYAEMGMEFEKQAPTKVAGYDVRNWLMAFDAEKMIQMNPEIAEAGPEAVEATKKMFAQVFGPEGWQMHMADVNGRLVSVMGGDDALLEKAIRNAASGTGDLRGALAEAVKTAGGNPSFLLHLEGRALARGILGMVEGVMPEGAGEIPAVPDGRPVPILLHASMDGRHYKVGMQTDVGAIADLIKVFMD